MQTALLLNVIAATVIPRVCLRCQMHLHEVVHLQGEDPHTPTVQSSPNS
jgi:hypothetical protein